MLVRVARIQLVQNKKHMVTQIKIDFSGAVNVGGAGTVVTYRLATAGKKGSYDAKNAGVLKLKSAIYNPAKFEVVLTPKKAFKLTKTVQLRVIGILPGGLQDILGRLIDGDHNGQAGGHAQALLSRGVTLS